MSITKRLIEEELELDKPCVSCYGAYFIVVDGNPIDCPMCKEDE